MKPWNFLAVKLAILLVLGILLGNFFDIRPVLGVTISVSSIMILAAAYIFISRKSILFGVCAVLTTLSTGALSYSLCSEMNHSGHYLEADLSHQMLWHLKIQKTEKHTPFNRVYLARVLSLNHKSTRGSIQLRIKQSNSAPLEIDDEILVLGKAYEIAKPLNPYQWDYRNYMKNRNIYHQIRTSNQFVHPLNSGRRTIRGWATVLRNTLLNKLDKTGVAERELSIVKAILLGERGDISEETFNSFRKAGAIHILAVSGLHVGIILLLLRFVFRPLTRLPGGSHITLVLSVVLLWGYAILAGFGPSVIRAVAMFSFLAYSLFLNRISHGYNTLSLSLLFLLLVVNPLLIFDLGFQMSYAAVGAILWIYPVLIRIWRPRLEIVKRIWQIAAVSLAAQLGVLPISLIYFHQFPGLFLLSSLIVIPFLGIILGMGFAVIILAMFSWLPKLLTEIYGMIIFCLNEFIVWVSGMDSFHLDNLPFGPMELVLIYLFIFFLIQLLQKPSAKKLRFTLICFMSIQLCGIFYSWDMVNTNRLLIAHQFGYPLLIEQDGKRLRTYTSTKTIHPKIIRSYQLGARTRQLEESSLKNSYEINGQSLIRLDSSLILLSQKEIEYLWLTHSPKVNLDRYLASYTPKQIIADGSSPPYLVNRWKESARSRNIPFHYTGIDGAFEFKR